MNYEEFLKNLDLKLAHYFDLHKQFIHCKAGCSACCKKGDYPLYPIELEYLMQGYISLDNATKQIVQQNIKEIEKGGACPFLVDDKCSVYKYRPIICSSWVGVFVQNEYSKIAILCELWQKLFRN